LASRNAQRYENLRVLALNQQRYVLAGGLRLVLKLLHRLYALTVDAEDDVTRLHARGGSRSCYFFDDEIALRLRLLFFLRIQRADCQTKLAGLVGCTVLLP